MDETSARLRAQAPAPVSPQDASKDRTNTGQRQRQRQINSRWPGPGGGGGGRKSPVRPMRITVQPAFPVESSPWTGAKKGCSPPRRHASPISKKCRDLSSFMADDPTMMDDSGKGVLYRDTMQSQQFRDLASLKKSSREAHEKLPPIFTSYIDRSPYPPPSSCTASPVHANHLPRLPTT